MNINNEYNDPKNSLVLFELGDKLDFLIHLHNIEKDCGCLSKVNKQHLEFRIRYLINILNQ